MLRTGIIPKFSRFRALNSSVFLGEISVMADVENSGENLLLSSILQNKKAEPRSSDSAFIPLIKK
jgi:hypothetical protein